MLGSNPVDYEGTLNKLFLILCYDHISASGRLNKIRVIFNDYMPIIGISLSTIFNSSLYKMASSDGMNDILFSECSQKIDCGILKAVNNDMLHSATSSIDIPTDSDILCEMLENTTKQNIKAIYIPLGAFDGFPGRSQLVVYLSKDIARLEDAVACCERFRPALVFLSSLLFRSENWHFSEGKLTTFPASEQASGKQRENAWKSLAELNREHIQRVLAHTGGKVAGKLGAAERLGLKPSTLWAKIRKYGIEVPRPKTETT